MKITRYPLALVCLLAGVANLAIAQEEVTPPTSEPTADARASDELPWRGDHCIDDTDCFWDNGCFPTRCIDTNAGAFDECEESLPPPGTCNCIERQCTLIPTRPEERRSSATECASNSECAIDIGSGTCHLNGNTMVGPIERTGPICLCDATSAACVFHWVEPVPCTSFRDCWYDTEPRLRPVRASEPREAPVVPCIDGEIDAVCAGTGETRFCAIISWEC